MFTSRISLKFFPSSSIQICRNLLGVGDDFISKHIRKVKKFALLNWIFTAFSKISWIKLLNNKISMTYGTKIISIIICTADCTDDKIIKFEDSGVYAPQNSVTLYKMYSSYLSVIPKEQLPFDIEKLNEAVLSERGYYAMLLKKESTPASVLRFNINAFKNDYSLADLSKMNLTYYGVQVGTCKQRELGIDKEFEFQNKPAEVTAESILGADGETQKQEDSLAVYDIVLAGVKV